MQAKGMRRVALAGGKVHVFSSAKRIILQVRAAGPDDDPLVTWAKAAAALSPTDAVQLAGELFHAAVQHGQTPKPAASSPQPSASSLKPNPAAKPKPKSDPQPASKSKPDNDAAVQGPNLRTTPS